MFILCFDFGKKYIGVAVGQSISKTATPLCTIVVKNKHYLWSQICTLMNTWKPLYIVVGKPTDLSFNNLILLNKIDKFIFTLKNKFKIEVYSVDESLSTWYVKSIYFFKKNKDYYKKVNSYSAMVLLQQWLCNNRYL